MAAVNLLGDVAIVGIFWLVFVGWFLYRWLVKNDLARHRHEVSTALFFLVVMSVVYWTLLA